MSAQPADLTKLRIDRSAPRRGGRGVWVLLLLLLVAFAGYVGWREGLIGPPQRTEVVLGRVVRSGNAPARTGTSANGYVIARTTAALSTDIQGRLVEITVEEGDTIEEGGLVARLDTRQLEASFARAKADVESALARLADAELDLERLENLVPTGDARAADRDGARALRDQAKADLASLRATADEIEVRIDNSSVYAPFTGVVTQKNAEVGEVVSSISGAGNSRGAVATIVDFDTLEVQVELAQTSLAVARVGAPVLIYLDAFPRDAYRGRVRQIWPTANRTKATVELRVEFLERDERILPEMGVRVTFLDDVEEAPEDDEAPKVSVPVRAVVDDGAGAAVFVYVDGRVQRRAIEVDGEVRGGLRAVTEGLVGGESVVLDPPPTLTDGEEVRIRNES